VARNVSLFGRRELAAHRRFVTGVTASMPIYKEVDGAGNKEWVVDVYLGPLELVTANVLKDVPIAPYARNLVTDLMQPVTLERSRDGKYTVTGRAKVLAAGAMAPDGDIEEPTFHRVLHNLADLRLRHIADLDYVLEPYQETPTTPLQTTPDEPMQTIRAYDAFGNQVLGPEVEDPLELYAIEGSAGTQTRHVQFVPAKYGPPGDPLAMQWGEPGSIYQPVYQVVVTDP